MNTQNTTADTVRRTLSACAVLGAALVGLAQPQIATAQTEISASIVPAQRYRAPDNGSSAVTIGAADAGQLARSAGASDLNGDDRLLQLKAAEARVFQLKAAEARVFQLKAADRGPAQLKAADRGPAQLKAAEWGSRVYLLKAADRGPAQLKSADRAMSLQSADRAMSLKSADRAMSLQAVDRGPAQLKTAERLFQ